MIKFGKKSESQKPPSEQKENRFSQIQNAAAKSRNKVKSALAASPDPKCKKDD